MIQDLAERLAEAEGLQKNEAQAFVRVFFETISKGLEDDKYVKVKGLGTFKLVEVDSRESVNVNTGERFMIDGHAKITFTPDNGLKELVNRPFAYFDTVVLSDEISDDVLDEVDRKSEEVLLETNGLQEADEAETEISQTEPVIENPENEVSDSAEKPLEEEPLNIEFIEEQEIKENDSPSEKLAETESVQVETPTVLIAQVSEEVKESTSNEDEVTEKTDNDSGNRLDEKSHSQMLVSSEPLLVKLAEPVNVNVAAKPMESQKQEEESENRNHHFRSIWIFLCVVALLLGYILGFFNVFSPGSAYRPSIIHDTVFVQKIVHDTIVQEKVVPNELVKETVSAEVKEEPKTTSNKNGKQNVSAEVPNDIPQLKGGAFLIVGTKSTYTLRGGETIRIIAERYYGSREMAPYIALYNNISDANKVAAGTVLKIPDLKRKRK